ncbi:MAG: hypothetical protein ABJL99_21300 [Aliishimia sp.]
MRNTFLILIAALAVSACTPLSIYHRPGASVAKLNADTLGCEVKALKDAPVALQKKQDPPTFVPPRKVCDSSGQNCYREGGEWIPGRIYTVDVNKPLRERVEVQCMANRGYSPVAISQCPVGVKASGQTTVLPTLSSASCAIINDDGTYLIVNRG